MHGIITYSGALEVNEVAEILIYKYFWALLEIDKRNRD